MEARTGGSVQGHSSPPRVVEPVPVPVPPPLTRRPRGREESSRLMRSSSAAGDLHMSSASASRHNHHETSRSLDSLFPIGGIKQHQNRSKPSTENRHRLDTRTPSRSLLNKHPSSASSNRLRRLSVDTYDREAKLFTAPSPLPISKIQADTKSLKKKVLRQETDAHSLKLLHGRYLQWRFANATAQLKTQAQIAKAERMFFSVGSKISEIYDSVQNKRIELQRLLKSKAVIDILESQICYLEQWTALEDGYSTSVSELSEALLSALLQLPLDLDIKVETKDLADTLARASKSMEGIVQNLGNCLPQTQELQKLMSELARLNRSEKASVEDCGVALLQTYSLQIEESYLRSLLIQLINSTP